MVKFHCRAHCLDNPLFKQCSDFELERLLSMACRSGDMELTDSISNGWAGMLTRCSHRHLTNALSAAEKLALSKFVGDVYYVAFLRTSRAVAGEVSSKMMPDIGLGARHHTKLYILSAFLQRFWLTSGSIQVGEELGPIHRGCAKAWREMWDPVSGCWMDPVGSLTRYTTGCKKAQCAYQAHAVQTLERLSESIPNLFT